VIIANIIGGLGNQMFQYAAGRAISWKRGTALFLDVSAFEDYGLHQGFELQRIFNCSAEIATESDMRRILSWQYSPCIRRQLVRPGLSRLRRKGFVVEPHFRYWQGIEDIPQDCYLMGYWQSEKYFAEAAEQIRAEFTFRLAMTQRNAELSKQISQVSAVSLHVRRGDYANNPQTLATHGLCSPDYYRASIGYIADHVQQPHFFIFSDDIAWVRNHLPIDFPHEYIDHNRGAESYNDMRLMSMCKHHIIANSSFSWWGAWLNPKADKVVIAPKRWFAHSGSTQDLIPESWVRL
jgi:hypothetical protein